MAHNDYAVPANQIEDTTVLEPSIVQKLDAATAQGIDGDNGGTWSPVAALIVGGKGISLATGSITGAVTTRAKAPAGALVLGNGGYANFIAPRSRTITFPIRNALQPEGSSATATDNAPSLGHGTVQIRAVGTSALGHVATWRMSPGETIASVTMTMRIGIRPLAIPTHMPGFRIRRLTQNATYSATTSEIYYIPDWQILHAYNVGDVVKPTGPFANNGRQFRCRVSGLSGVVQPPAFNTAVSGQDVVDNVNVHWTCEPGPTTAYGHYARLAYPASIDAYVGGFNARAIVMTPITNAIVDATTYAYSLDIDDQSQTVNLFHSLTFALTGATDMRPGV